eukprot:CFRG7597T1
MDFSSFMKAELDAKKKALEGSKKGGKSWMKRSDLREEEKKRKLSTLVKRLEKNADNDSTAVISNKKRKAHDHSSAGTSTRDAMNGASKDVANKGLASTSVTITADEEDLLASVVDTHKSHKMASKEVVRQLRDRNEPIRLFGETDDQRINRLQYLKTHEAVADEGLRNDFMDAVDRVNEKYLQSFLLEKQQSEEEKEKDRLRKKEERALIESVTKNQIIDLYTSISNLTNTASDNATFCLRYVQYLLMKWEDDLDTKDSSEKQTAKGKKESAIYNQTCAYIEPLQTQLKEQSLGDDMMPFLTQIFKSIHERQYIYAADMYLRMAIGNAAWPIGVTMVGIHARTGREKIFSQHVAHVLNDEEQRKYIQALKRLMTYAQNKFPTDPSRCLEFEAIAK